MMQPRIPQGLRQKMQLRSQVSGKPCSLFLKRKTVVMAKTENQQETVEADSFLPKREPGNFPPIGHHIPKADSVLEQDVDIAKEAPVTTKEEFDPLRDGPARYLGYANEVGEAFRAWLPSYGVPLSYAVAIGYVLTDTIDKSIKAYKQADIELNSDRAIPKQVNTKRLTALLTTERFIDTLVWQMAASVIIPGTTIHLVVDLVHFILSDNILTAASGEMPANIAAAISELAIKFNTESATIVEYIEKTVPTMCGLAAIPFIVEPIDDTVHALLDNSLRPAFKKYICEQGQGNMACLDMCDECAVPEELISQSQNGNGASTGASK